jgi:hypothetical protein
MAATVCSSVSFFACIVHRDTAGLVVWSAAYRSHRSLLCDARRSDRGKLSALLAQQKRFSGEGGREIGGPTSPARQSRRGLLRPPPTGRGLLVWVRVVAVYGPWAGWASTVPRPFVAYQSRPSRFCLTGLGVGTPSRNGFKKKKKTQQTTTAESSPLTLWRYR